MTKEEFELYVRDVKTKSPKWFKREDVVDYIVDTELAALQQQMKHSEFIRLLKTLVIHNFKIDLDLIDRIETMSNEKAMIK